MTYQSIIAKGAVCSHLTWPRIAPGYAQNEQHYMVPFKQASGLPSELFHWQPFVDVMLAGVYTEEPIYLMVDQQYVEKGKPHRRPGLHIDGYWHGGDTMHGPRHFPSEPKWHPYPPTHSSGADDWNNPDFSQDEAIILMTNIKAARGYAGDWDGFIGHMGDCSKIDVTLLDPVDFEPNRAYIGNVSMLHESLPVPETCERTVIRLNCPGVKVA